MKNSIKLTMAIAGALLLITVCSAQAGIVIDTFDDGFQSAPPRNEIATPSAIGGYRVLDQPGEGSNSISVLVSDGVGFLIESYSILSFWICGGCKQKRLVNGFGHL